MNVIEFQNLTKYYGDVKGCENVDFNVKEGEIFGFIGPNGAGKSTTIRTMLGLIFPTSGSVEIFGKEAIEFGPEIREKIGYLPSEIFYYDKMKVRDLLAYSASFYEGDFTERIEYLAKEMELNLDRKIQDLSYGNKKKVGIVQGLLHEPKLIILDEPTSGLDPLMQKKFFQLIKEENKKGATVLFSSHILSEVQQLCDRVAIIKDGEIISVQDVKEIIEDNYKKFTLVGDGFKKSMFKFKGMTNFSFDEGKVTFFYKGSINEIIKHLAMIDMLDLRIEEPTLEEIFMHYYE
jgi:ABC-2 type transport system ATP-binding protein